MRPAILIPLSLSLFAPCIAAAEIQNIAIGFNNSWFDETLNRTATEGTVLVFHFSPSPRPPVQHSIVQTTLENPCVALSGGFSSGVAPLNGSDFTLTVVNASLPVYFACSQHCHDGEVGVINAPSAPSPASFESFVRAAMESNVTDFDKAINPSPPGTGFGAVVLSHAESQALSHSSHTFPAWAIGLVFLGFMGIFMGTLYLCMRRYFARRHAEWLARRSQLRGEDTVSRPETSSSGGGLVYGANGAPKEPRPFILDGFPI